MWAANEGLERKHEQRKAAKVPERAGKPSLDRFLAVLGSFRAAGCGLPMNKPRKGRPPKYWHGQVMAHCFDFKDSSGELVREYFYLGRGPECAGKTHWEQKRPGRQYGSNLPK